MGRSRERGDDCEESTRSRARRDGRSPRETGARMIAQGVCLWSGSTYQVTTLHGSIAGRGGSDGDRLGIARFDGRGGRLREEDWV